MAGLPGICRHFAAYTGLRTEEPECLRIRDLNLFAQTPYVRVERQAQYSKENGWEYITPKSRKSIRTVPLHAVLVRRLRNHLEQYPLAHDPEAPLSPGRRRGGHGKSRGAPDYTIPFNHDNLYRKHFLPALEALHIPAVRWHDLRHVYASVCASSGTIPIEKVAKWMRHEDTATMYKHYLHLFDDDFADDMDRLAEVASRPAPRRIGA